MEIISLRHCGFDTSIVDPILRDYICLYKNTFTDPSEREDPFMWGKYIVTDPYTDHLPVSDVIIVGKNLREKGFEIFGGCNIEYYWRSKVLLITYIAVKDKYRQLGIAKLLFSFSKSLSRYYYGGYSYVMCETENPDVVKESVIDPYTRTKIIGSLGGKRIDIGYVQPRLSGGFGRVSHLYLICFPDNRDDGHIESVVVRGFLSEFYDALSYVTGDDNSEDLNDMILQIGDNESINLISM